MKHSIRTNVMTLAHQLKSKLGFGEAQKQAWKTIKAREAMKNNICTITFTKSDGTLRTAKATLIPAFLPTPKADSKPRNQVSNKVTYFDLEKGQFRSFLPIRFVSIEKVESLLSVVQSSLLTAA